MRLLLDSLKLSVQKQLTALIAFTIPIVSFPAVSNTATFVTLLGPARLELHPFATT